MAKLAKAAVRFEHPAKGPHHCSECEHYRPPHSCAIVQGEIDRDDWCQKFKPKERYAGFYGKS